MRWIENAARDWYRFASMWFMWGMGAFITWTATFPKEWGDLVTEIPQPWRALVLFVVFAATGSVLRLTSFKRGV